MKYLGSKNRIAKDILPIMLEGRTDEVWVEPFVGGANMIDKVEGKRIGSDLNEYVISLLNQMSKPDYTAPEISEEKYNDIKKYPDQYPRWIVGYAGTQLSFGATWFGSYRRDNTGKRNYCMEARNNVNKQSNNLKGVEFIACSYKDLKIPPNSLIYCDPPYDTKATKGKYKDNFNHAEFWETCRNWHKQGHRVFVSEYDAPKDFICVWEKKMNQRMNNNADTSKTVERLFTLNGFGKDEARGQINLCDNADTPPMKNEQPLCLRTVSGSNTCKQCGVELDEGFRFCSGLCKEYYYR